MTLWTSKLDYLEHHGFKNEGRPSWSMTNKMTNLSELSRHCARQGKGFNKHKKGKARQETKN